MFEKGEPWPSKERCADFATILHVGSDNANTTRILAAAHRLEEKLRDLNIDELNLSDYNTRYLGSLIATSSDRKANLTKYAYLIMNVVNSCESDLCELVFLDHGGGHGLMSLLAVEAGFRSVVYNDDEASCTDAALVELHLD